LIPPDLRAHLRLTGDQLEQELLAMTDRFTDELFALPPERAAQVIFPVSRLILDPERFIEDAMEPMTTRGMGVIYTHGSQGQAIRRAPSMPCRAALISRFYEPHHAALHKAVEAAVSYWDRFLVIDCHSFPSRPLPYELDQCLDRPEICLGTDSFHTPRVAHDVRAGTFR
jgi:N-formylglutamate deformylase